MDKFQKMLNFNKLEFLKKMNIYKYFKNDKKIIPGRWGNVGDFASKNEEKAKNRKEIWTAWTTMDHCGDDKCGTPETYAEVNKELNNKKK